MKNIIVREYLESLKEDRELDAIFPILLEVMDFQIITTPKTTKGYQQFGKDVVAVGIDPADGIKKRFYFEIKGESDKDITNSNYFKQDGVRESILEAKDRPFRNHSHPEFNHLPIKIVFVHNGVVKEGVRETYEGFIEATFPKIGQLMPKGKGGKSSERTSKIAAPILFEYERWGIYELSLLFSEKLFNEYLLVDDISINLFKRVLLLFSTPGNNNADFRQLINRIFEQAGAYQEMSRRRKVLLSETLKLISYVVHTYAKEAGNLESARQCLNYAVLAYWNWILANNIETDRAAVKHFNRFLLTYRSFLDDYFGKTLPVAEFKNGLWSPHGGRYEQVGYPMRSLSYLASLANYYELINFDRKNEDPSVQEQVKKLSKVIENNSGTHRPLLDVHSIPIVAAISFFIKNGAKDEAVKLLRLTWTSIIRGYQSFKRLPDASMRVKNVSQFMITQKKNIYYVDTTSHLMGILFEYLVVLDLKDDFIEVQQFLIELNITLGVFVPYDDQQLLTMPELSSDSHEISLFSHTLHYEGYQSEISYREEFPELKTAVLAKREFSYDYRTRKAGFGFLIDLAHTEFLTPFFPDRWRIKNTIPAANNKKPAKTVAKKSTKSKAKPK